MLNDYKPTHDPNIDTFKVQYLLGISGILALLSSHDYRISEVRFLISLYSKYSSNESSPTAPRFSGHSPSGWSLLQFFPNCSCCNGPEKQIRLPRTICLPWGFTELSIFRIGYTGTLLKRHSNGHSSLFLSLLVSSRPCSTRTSSTFTTISEWMGVVITHRRE